jgi:hypothetical protein
MQRQYILTGPTFESAFWAKVNKTDTCWLWTASRCGKGLYGQFRGDLAHRVSYRLAKDEIPVGLEIDHLCRVKLCVNPLHLEAVTSSENKRRAAPFNLKQVCKHGHAMNGENVIFTQGVRRCRECYREKSRMHMRRKRARAKS